MNTNTIVLPDSVKTWISDFCSGRTDIMVVSSAHTTNAYLRNMTVNYVLNLIKSYAVIQRFIRDDKDRLLCVRNYTSDCIDGLVFEPTHQTLAIY